MAPKSHKFPQPQQAFDRVVGVTVRAGSAWMFGHVAEPYTG